MQKCSSRFIVQQGFNTSASPKTQVCVTRPFLVRGLGLDMRLVQHSTVHYSTLPNVQTTFIWPHLPNNTIFPISYSSVCTKTKSWSVIKAQGACTPGRVGAQPLKQESFHFAYLSKNSLIHFQSLCCQFFSWAFYLSFFDRMLFVLLPRHQVGVVDMTAACHSGLSRWFEHTVNLLLPAVKEARLKEIRAEILNSEKLKVRICCISWCFVLFCFVFLSPFPPPFLYSSHSPSCSPLFLSHSLSLFNHHPLLFPPFPFPLLSSPFLPPPFSSFLLDFIFFPSFPFLPPPFSRPTLKTIHETYKCWGMTKYCSRPECNHT